MYSNLCLVALISRFLPLVLIIKFHSSQGTTLFARGKETPYVVMSQHGYILLNVMKEGGRASISAFTGSNMFRVKYGLALILSIKIQINNQ